MKQATIGILGIMSDRTLDIEEELCACYIQWQKAFDCGKLILLKQILKVTAISCRERNLISKLYMDHILKCTQEASRLDEKLNRDAVYHQMST
jgi:hypothetical protein